MTAPTRHRRVALLSGAIAAVGVACGPGFLDGLVGGAPSSADGGDASSTIDGEALITCEPATIPVKPSNAPTGDQLNLYFALEAIRLDAVDNDAGGVPKAKGLDLDGFCTCPELHRSCATPDASNPALCDGPEGRDNGLGRAFAALNDYVPQFEQGFATSRIRNGGYNILVHLERYNGQADDAEVLVTLFGSQRFDGHADGGVTSTDPTFDGTDIWTVDPRTLATGAVGADCRNPDALCTFQQSRVARSAEGNAWVSGGVLVARFGSAPIYMRTALGELAVDLDDLVLVAKLSDAVVAGRPVKRLDGELIGAWPASKALGAIASLEDVLTASGRRLCQLPEGGPFYQDMRQMFCQTIDLPTTRGAPKENPCTRLSAAISFLASEAQPPSRVFKRNETNPCADFADDCPR